MLMLSPNVGDYTKYLPPFANFANLLCRADNKDLDSISGELSTPLCEDSDLPPPAECDEERDRLVRFKCL